MKRLLIILSIFAFMITSCKSPSGVNQEPITYPETRTDDQTDTYFGVQISDPYRWLENDTSAGTGKWVEAQNEVTQNYISKIPFRNKIKERLEKLWNYPKLSTPFKKGKWVFFQKNEGLQNQFVLYVQEGLKGEPRVLLDPNTLSEDGTIALGDYSISKDGKYMAYILNKAGSDWSSIQVLDIETGKNLDDKIDWVKFSGAAWKDNGFYYSCYDKPSDGKELSNINEYHKVYYHKLGENQGNDKLVFENKHFPLRNYSPSTTEDERFLLISETESTSGNALYVMDLEAKNPKLVKVADGFKNDYSVMDNVGEKLMVLTNQDAPKYKLVIIDFNNPKSEWITIIPEREEVLQGITFGGDKMFAMYMKNATSKVYVCDLKGKKLHELELPTLGTVFGLNGEKNENTMFYGFTSFTYPSVVYEYDVEANKSKEFYRAKINLDTDGYETKQVFYESKDGTKVPMFIVHKKGLKMDGNNPVLLYGYGGFNISLTPSFSLSRMLFLENGGVYAMPNLRGGGEYGEKWHNAGTILQKQNVFDDFISAAEYLIKEKYTSKEKIAISGGSNGGLLVGACMTQRPDLFKVAMPAVGVLDMLRYHKFTIGWAWATDYGTSENKEEFENLLKYSPLHNVKEGVCYPATLITTGDHDDRVVPAHSFKFAAELQKKQKCSNPVLIRIETNAGHGAGKPTSKIIDEIADTYAFMFYNLGIKVISM